MSKYGRDKKKCIITTFWPVTLKERETGDLDPDKNKLNINLKEME
jgi:hypothetical protein